MRYQFKITEEKFLLLALIYIYELILFYIKQIYCAYYLILLGNNIYMIYNFFLGLKSDYSSVSVQGM